VGERVEKVDDVGSSRMGRGCVGYLTKQLDFIPSRLRIPSGGLDDLQGGMTSLSIISALEVGGRVEMYEEGTYRESLTSQTVEKWPHLRVRVMRQICVLWKEGNSPKLPYDRISSIFETICDFYLEVSAIIVVCRGFLILWRHGGRRQEGKANEATQILNHVMMVV
jgi:hypothetical protein